MGKTKKPRGRPAGTGQDDSKALDAVADELATHPATRPMTAMGIVADKLDLRPSRDSAIRRLKRKWDKDGPARLREARQRHAVEQMHRAKEAAQAVFDRWAVEMNKPEMRAFQEKMEAFAREAAKWQLPPDLLAMASQYQSFLSKL